MDNNMFNIDINVNEVVNNIEILDDRLHTATLVICDTVARQMENYAKNNRRWTDRTTNARRGLRGSAYWQDSQNIVTAVMHSVNYGVWLELAHNKKYAILEESVRANIEELNRALATLFGDDNNN